MPGKPRIASQKSGAMTPSLRFSASVSKAAVLTSWAAGKFSANTIANFIKENDIEGKIKNRTLLIPGKVAVLKGELEANLPGWEIVVAPKEAVQLVKFLKDLAASRA